MSLNEKKIENVNILLNQRNTNELIKSHINSDEINENPLILDLIKKEKKFRISPLTIYKPKLTPVKSIKNKKTIKLINNVNDFRQTFYDYNKNKKYPKNEIKPFEQKYNFQEKFKEFKNNTKEYFGEKDMLEEIKTKYQYNNFSLPSIEGENKNIFASNLLLKNDKNIKDSIMYNLISEKNEKKSFLYLNKVQKILNNKIIGKLDAKMSKITHDIKKEISWSKDFMIENELAKIRLVKDEISKSQDDIKNTSKIMKKINGIDFFFDSDNKKYLSSLKNKTTKKKSKLIASKRKFKSTCVLQPKSNLSNFSQIKKMYNAHKKALNNNDNIKLKTKSEIKNEVRKSDINNKSIISNISSIKDINEQDNKNEISMNENESISVSNNNKIPMRRGFSIAFFNIEEFKRRQNNLKKIIKINLNDKNYSKDSNNITMSTLPQYSLYDKIFSSFPPRETANKFTNNKKIPNTEKSKAEKLYETLRNTDDSLQYNNLIQNYLESQKFNLKPKISPNDICENYQHLLDKICKNDCIDRNIDLKRSYNIGLKSIKKLKNDYNQTHAKMSNIGNDMNRVFSNVSI